MTNFWSWKVFNSFESFRLYNIWGFSFTVYLEAISCQTIVSPRRVQYPEKQKKKTPKLVNIFSRVEHHFIYPFTTIQNIYIYRIQKKMSMNPILPLHTWWRHHLLNSSILNIDHKRTLEVVKRYVCVCACNSFTWEIPNKIEWKMYYFE